MNPRKWRHSAASIVHGRTVLTGAAAPRRIGFGDHLPRTKVGKILRRALKETA